MPSFIVKYFLCMFRLQDDDMDGEDFDLAKMANDGEGAELFYNCAVNDWLRISPDVQWLQPAFNRSDATWLLGLRVHMTL